MNEQTCPRCGKTFMEHPAISRSDNKTEICSTCGLAEALLASSGQVDTREWKQKPSK